MAECGPWLEAVKKTKNIFSVKKQDCKKWQVLSVKLKAELKIFCKSTQKVIAGVACLVRRQALGYYSSAFYKSFC